MAKKADTQDTHEVRPFLERLQDRIARFTGDMMAIVGKASAEGDEDLAEVANDINQALTALNAILQKKPTDWNPRAGQTRSSNIEKGDTVVFREDHREMYGQLGLDVEAPYKVVGLVIQGGEASRGSKRFLALQPPKGSPVPGILAAHVRLQ